jgi:hypothetical protein
LRPDERTFRHHIDAGPFQAGVDRGDWELVAIEWPHALIAVAVPPRVGAPNKVALRFELSDYPQQAPTAQPWDVGSDAPLPHALWPTGGQATEVFNPSWNQGVALYIPCDRQAISGHSAWLTAHQPYLWTPDRDITHYLRVVRDVLHRPGYTGVRQQAA